MLIAVDIDSTLHPYWDLLSAAARRRFGVELPYEEQLTWGITRLRPEQLAAVIADTHAEDRVLAAEPYSGAVDALGRWDAAGHRILIVSHRTPQAQGATETWLRRIGAPFEELHCSEDKIARCTAVGVELLIDDSPLNLQRALDLGIRVATISHPWNRDICQEEDVICAASWPELELRLAPILGGDSR
ncbi:MAG: hypothetical protein NVSMB51_05590 [Solirubrobacteraceae bacterium]